jgi:hypothetical protein
MTPAAGMVVAERPSREALAGVTEMTRSAERSRSTNSYPP